MTSIERKLRRRAALRDKLSVALIEIEDGLRSGTLTTAMDAAVSLERIEAMYRPILKLDVDILGDITDEMVTEETSNTTSFSDKVVKIMAELRYRSRDQHAGESLALPSVTRPPHSEPATIKTKLPTIELTKFDGDRHNWTRFWSQFEHAIHKNSELRATEKFHYLTSLLTGSAASAVTGLPITEQCYNDAIDILLKRFGDQTRIVQDHLRALIDIRAVSSSSDVAQLRKLYDEVQVHCRSLNSLGTSADTYCSMLRELLLRALPRDMILRYHQWSRTSCSASRSTGIEREQQPIDHKEKFDELMDFFGNEVECLEAVIQDTSDLTKFKKDDKPGEQLRTGIFEHEHTAAFLHAAALDIRKCLFCSASHDAASCETEDVTMEHKKSLLTKHGRCFRCLTRGHIARKCRKRIACLRCKRRHVSSMCNADRDSHEKRQVISAPLQLLSGQTGCAILLQTLNIQASGARSAERCRVLLDGGSQRSFITTAVSRKLGCEFLGKEVLTVGVFGGKETNETLRRVRVHLLDPTGEKALSVEALEVSSICNQMIPVPDQHIINVLKSHSIDTTDVLCGSGRDKGISILIGSDFYWDIVTGNTKTVGPSLKAVETRLGWTVQGRVQTTPKTVHCKNVVVLHASLPGVPFAIERFGESEATVSKDPVPASTRVQVSEDARYEHALPQKQDIDLSGNFDAEERRCDQLVKTPDKGQCCSRSENLTGALKKGIGDQSLLQSQSWWEEQPAWMSSHRELQGPKSHLGLPQKTAEEASAQYFTLQLLTSISVNVSRLNQAAPSTSLPFRSMLAPRPWRPGRCRISLKGSQPHRHQPP